jgi:CDP-L-myo-inositol myo-inositolphosphotransferase
MKKDGKESTERSVNTAVIVAAGLGTRISVGGGEDLPKPLMPLVGVPLIGRAMAGAARAGIRRIVVVIGHRAELMRERLPGLTPRGVELVMVENPRYEEPNGVSLLRGIEGLGGPFALLMSDHIFSPERLELAIEAFGEDGTPRLVVEKKEDFSGDLEDATLVRVDGAGFIAAIGKDLSEYDGIDTGMFVLDAGLVRKAAGRAGPSPSISEIMTVLAEDKKLKALFTDRGYWQDVDTPADVQEAEKKLYASLVKPADGFMARHVNRKVSLFLSTRLWRLGLTPNMVTTFTLALGLLAGLAFSKGSGAGWGLLGAALFQLHSIIDGVDGELARLLLKESTLGFWYDISADNLTHMAVFAGIAMGQRAGGVPGPWTALAVFSVLGVLISVIAVSPLLRPAGSNKARSFETGRLRKIVEALSSRDFSYLLFPLAIFHWLGGFLWIITIGTWIYSAMVILLRLGARRRGAGAAA